MDFSFTDEQELLHESIVEFCDRYINEKDIPSMYENHGTPHDLDMAYLEAGFGLMGLPEEHGGIPCDMVTLGMLTEEFVHNAGFTAPYLNATLALRDMVDFGSPEQIKMCFDAYQETGKPIFSLGFSEPGAGSDNQNMTSVTRKQPDGTYLLNGQKTWVTNGENFPLVLVIAKDEDPSRDNRAMWLVPLDTPGLTTAPLHKIGQQIMPFCEMYFDDVVLTEDMRVGNKGEGFKNLMKNFEVERCLICAQVLGLAQAAMDDAAAYASERICFGRPSSSSSRSLPTWRLPCKTPVTCSTRRCGRWTTTSPCASTRRFSSAMRPSSAHGCATRQCRFTAASASRPKRVLAGFCLTAVGCKLQAERMRSWSTSRAVRLPRSTLARA